MERSRRGHRMEFPKVVISAEMAAALVSAEVLSGHALPGLSLQPLFGGVTCSPSLAHSSSVYRPLHIYHICHLQVHMSYPSSAIFPIPPSPISSSCVCTHRNRFTKQSNHGGNSVLFLPFVIKMTQKKNSSATYIFFTKKPPSSLCNPLWKINYFSSLKT